MLALEMLWINLNKRPQVRKYTALITTQHFFPPLKSNNLVMGYMKPIQAKAKCSPSQSSFTRLFVTAQKWQTEKKRLPSEEALFMVNRLMHVLMSHSYTVRRCDYI